eukprot:COSAG04_NODE_312_length_17133_cov_31.976928_13_plen_52_part_00
MTLVVKHLLRFFPAFRPTLAPSGPGLALMSVFGCGRLQNRISNETRQLTIT